MAFDTLSERFAEVGLDFPPAAEAEFTDADGMLMITGWYADLDSDSGGPLDSGVYLLVRRGRRR